MSQARLSVVTGTRNRYQSLSRFLRSVNKCATIPCEIIVADASDEMQELDPIAPSEWNQNVVRVHRYHESPRLNPNLGYDQLCRKATTEYVMFFNDDAETTPGLDRTAVEFMDRNSEVGIGCLFWFDLPNGAPYLQSWQGLLYPNFGIIRKSAADQWGWFETRKVFIPELGEEEALSFYGMDTGIALKCVDAGFACVPVPGTLVHHHREQDEERRQNMAKHLHDDRRMPPGSLPGTILRRLWNGDDPNLGGYARLREKAAKFQYLTGAIDRNGNVTA